MINELKEKIKNNFIYLTLIILIFFLDRSSKNEIIQVLENQNSIYINDYVNFSLTFNTGIGFGLLSLEAGLLYNIISFFIFLIILYLIFLLINSNKFEKFFFSFIVGGAIGNLFDRITYKAVPDFIDIHYNSFHWFSFNIADIFISLGILMILMKEIFYKNETT